VKKKLASIFCAIFRHSHLVTNCIGYKYCARCGTQFVDSLGGSGLPVPPHFGIGQTCQCEPCRASFNMLTWVDRFMCPKAVCPTDEYVASEKKKKREFLEAIMASRADRERVRI
jgi:hypothetical protein